MPGISINVANRYNASDYVPIYGNYCGPGWTGGERVDANAPGDFSVPPVDAIDALCKVHDEQYGLAAITSDPAAAARIIANADMALLRDASTLLAKNMLPDVSINDRLDASGLAYTQLAIDAFAVKALTIDSVNVIKGEVQNMLQGLSDFIKSRSGVPVSYQDQFGTISTLSLEDDGGFELTSSATLDDGSTLWSEAVSSPYEEGAGQVGVVTRNDGSVGVVANGDGESVWQGNVDVYVAPESTVAIDQPGNDVYGTSGDEINVYTNNTSVTANDSEINFFYDDFSNNFVSGYNNTVEITYSTGGYSPGYLMDGHNGVDSRTLGFEFSELDDASDSEKGPRGKKIDLGSVHHVKVQVSSATPVSIEHLIQSIAAFGNQSSGVVDGFAFTNTIISDSSSQQPLHSARLLAPSQ